LYLDFKGCLRLLEECDDYEGVQADYYSSLKRNPSEDYDDENYYDEEEAPANAKRQLKFKRDVNVSAYLEGLKRRVSLMTASATV
jgi:uncharacterized lipoprotein YddW (UPF0748 family)